MSVTPEMTAMAKSARDAGTKIMAAADALGEGDASKAVAAFTGSVTDLESLAAAAAEGSENQEVAVPPAVDDDAAAADTDGKYVGKEGEGPIYVAWKNGKNADGTDADENAPEPADKSLGGGKKKKRRGGKSLRGWKKNKKGGKQSKKRR
jgi:hypothetical protein